MYFSVLYSGTYQDVLKQDSKVSYPEGSTKSTLSADSKADSLKTFQSSGQSLVENKELLVNPNCSIGLIIDFISGELGFDKSNEFDLFELETGAMVGVQQLKPYLNGARVFKSAQSYIIIFYEKDEAGDYTRFEPLVSKHCKTYLDIKLRIKRALNPSRRKSSLLKKKKGSGSSGSTKSHTSRKGSTRRGSKQGSFIK